MAKTVKIRAAVAVDLETEEWAVIGDGRWSEEATGRIGDTLSFGDGRPKQVTWITAEIPIQPETVEAKVETNDRS